MRHHFTVTSFLASTLMGALGMAVFFFRPKTAEGPTENLPQSLVGSFSFLSVAALLVVTLISYYLQAARSGPKTFAVGLACAVLCGLARIFGSLKKSFPFCQPKLAQRCIADTGRI